ncbi:MAG: VPLPA-CTERM sorting domain-containing protein [Gammaproteobacteria bacterium]
MKMHKFMAVALLLITAHQSHAALEYLRISGVATEYCINMIDGPCELALAEYGLVDGQFVYFDVVIDTDVDDPINPDQSFIDYFSAFIIAGTEISGVDYASLPTAATNSYPEGSDTLVFFDPNLAFGVRLYNLGTTFTDVSIDTWVVGTEMELLLTNSMAFADRAGGSIADLHLVYRSDVPSPAIVPLPVSLWLLLSAFGGLTLFTSNTKSIQV